MTSNESMRQVLYPLSVKTTKILNDNDFNGTYFKNKMKLDIRQVEIDMVCELSSMILTQAPALHMVKFKYPATWWQFLKHQFFPHWALRRWPVRYACEAKSIEVRAGYPLLKANAPGREPVIFYVSDGD